MSNINIAYVEFLEAKLKELEAQMKVVTTLNYYKDARIRSLNAEILLLRKD